MVLKNLFKHKVPLYLTSNDRDIEEPYFRNICYHYHSNIIEDGGKIGINNPDDLYNKLTPFIRYVLSTMKHKLSELFYSTFNIYLERRDETDDENFTEFIKMVHFELNSNFMFENILPLQCLSRYDERLFKTPFAIHVEVFRYFNTEVGILNEAFTSDDENEYDSEYEVEEQPKPIEDHFKTDKCVICMKKSHVFYSSNADIYVCVCLVKLQNHL